jgi:Ras family protein T1
LSPDRGIHHQSRLNKAFVPSFSVNILPIYGQDRYLVLEEINVTKTDKVNENDGCDVIALAYDVSDPLSFEFISSFYQSKLTNSDVPVLVVGLKADQRTVDQETSDSLQPEDWIKQHSQHPILYFTCADRVSRDVFVRLGTMAAYPGLRDYTMPTVAYEPAKVVLGVGMMAGLGFALYRGFKLYNPSLTIIPK